MACTGPCQSCLATHLAYDDTGQVQVLCLGCYRTTPGLHVMFWPPVPEQPRGEVARSDQS